MSASSALSDCTTCVFDAYGTLFDVNSAVARHRDSIGPLADRLAEMWRSKQLQYTWLRSLMGRYETFWVVTGEALEHSMEALGISDATLRSTLMDAYLSLSAYGEVPSVLDQLQAAGMRCAILSNGDPQMLEAAVGASGLSARFEAVLSVDSVRTYKPDARVYRLVEDAFAVAPRQVCFLSSNCWDAHGAAEYGFGAVWVNRTRAPNDMLPGEFAATLNDLSGLPALLAEARTARP
jgi:2-haloacid dehalogenase